MDRMTPLDAAFLQAEDEEPGVSLAICSVAVFEGPPPSTEEFAELLRGRLPLIPRYRQKARQVPFDLSHRYGWTTSISTSDTTCAAPRYPPRAATRSWPRSSAA